MARTLDKLCDRLDTLNTLTHPQKCADTMDEARLALLALRTENETLRAKLAQAEGEIATIRGVAIEWRRARLAACAAPIGTPSVWTELGSAETALSEAIRALTTPEHPKP